MKQEFIQGKINVIDDIMSSTQISTFNQLLVNEIKWGGDLDAGTSTMRNQFFKDNGIESVYEQFQFSTMERIKNFNGDQLDEFNPSLTHIVYFPLMQWCFHKGMMLPYKNIIRCKINFQTKAPEEARGKFNAPHCDLGLSSEKIYLTALYYLNDSDGDTYFFNEGLDEINDVKNINNLSVLAKVSPKAGRLVIFPSDITHAGSHPIDSAYRIVINFNFQLQTSYDFESLEGRKKQNYSH